MLICVTVSLIFQSCIILHCKAVKMYVFIVLLIDVWVVFSISWHSSNDALNIFVCIFVSIYANVFDYIQ